MEEQVEELEAAILEAKAGKDDNRRLVKELEKAKKRFGRYAEIRVKCGHIPCKSMISRNLLDEYLCKSLASY